jgi:hypothetical protein
LVPYFVKSEANWSDGCTKNLPQKLFAEHEKVLMYGIMPYRREDVTMAIKSIESGSTSITTGIPITSPEQRQFHKPGTPTHRFWEESDRSYFTDTQQDFDRALRMRSKMTRTQRIRSTSPHGRLNRGRPFGLQIDQGTGMPFIKKKIDGKWVRENYPRSALGVRSNSPPDIRSYRGGHLEDVQHPLDREGWKDG